ncbi:alpha/beta fold hydrolase [Nocardioides sp. GY 10127]|nr:alpha/beta fold hydrolase [Nocardioides sp. GY 10127]
MREIGDALAGSSEVALRVHAAERAGHGRTPEREGPLSYADMVEETLAYLDACGLGSAHLVGFSDGGIVGLLLARDHAERVRSLVAISANLTPDAFAPETSTPVPPAIQGRINDDNAALSPGGQAAVERLEDKLRDLWVREPVIEPTSLGAVTAPTLVVAGEHDMIAPAHTELIAASVPGASLAFVPGTGHLLVAEQPGEVAALVLAHLAPLVP